MEASSSMAALCGGKSKAAAVIARGAQDRWRVVGKDTESEKQAKLKLGVVYSLKEAAAAASAEFMDNGAGKSSSETRRQKQRKRQRQKRRESRRAAAFAEDEAWKKRENLDTPPPLAPIDTSSDESENEHGYGMARKKQELAPKMNGPVLCTADSDTDSMITGNGPVCNEFTESASLIANNVDESSAQQASQWPGLDPPRVNSGERVSGKNKRQHRRENKAARILRQEQQPETSYSPHFFRREL